MSKSVTIVNHTHWDREWYFSDQDSLVLSSILFTNAVDELERHKNASFVLDGQMSILTDYLRAMPQMKPRIEKLVASGQLQIGPWYTQPDALHVQGEALLRNGMIGTLLANRIGERMAIGYLPDTFGFNAQLPVILNQLGLKRFLFWRGIDPTQTKGFYFNWESLGGGSQVAAADMPQGYSTGMMLAPTREYVDQRLDKAIDFLTRESPSPTEEVLIPSGNDQMNIVTSIEDKVAKINEMGKNHYRVGTYQSFFDRMNFEDLPHYRGELIEPLFARVHRTCGSSRMDTKLAATKLEHTLVHEVEPLMIIAKKCKIDIDNGVLVSAWEKLLESQAHDSMAGSVVDSVNDDILHRLKQGQEIAEGLINTIQKMLSLKLGLSSEQVLILNPLPKESKAAVEVTVLTREKTVGFENVDEGTLLSRRYVEPREHILKQTPSGDKYITEPGYYVSKYRLVSQWPALGYKVVKFHETTTADPVKTPASESVFGNSTWHMEFKNGQLNLLWNGETIPHAIELLDDGNAGDTYDFSPLEGDTARVIPWRDAIVSRQGTLQTLKLTADPMLPLNLHDRKLGETKASMPITMLLTTGEKGLIDIKLKVKNTIYDHRLRLRIDSGLKSEMNTASVPFGFITRQNKQVPEEWAKKYSEKPVNIWSFDNNATVTDGARRLTVYSRDVKEYAQDDGSLLLTLFATTNQLGKPNLIYRPGRASGDTTNEGHVMIATPEAELLNQTLRYHFQIALSDSPKEEDVAREQELFSFRPIGYQRQQLNLFFHRLDNKLQDSLVRQADLPMELSVYTAPTVGTVSACYPSYFEADRVVLRLENMTKQPVTYTPEQNQGVVNALEQSVAYDGQIDPYDVITLLIRD